MRLAINCFGFYPRFALKRHWEGTTADDRQFYTDILLTETDGVADLNVEF